MTDDEFDRLQDEYDLCGVDGRLRDFADAIEARALEQVNACDAQLSRVLHEMAGSVSLCWAPRPEGVFESTTACEFVAAAVQELRNLLRPNVAIEPRR